MCQKEKFKQTVQNFNGDFFSSLFFKINLLILIYVEGNREEKETGKTEALVIINPPQRCDNGAAPEVGLDGTSALPDNKTIASSVFLSSRCLTCKHSACRLVSAFQQF